MDAGRGIRLSADWVVPVDGPPIPRGMVGIDARGRIAAVGPTSDPGPTDAVATERFAGVLLPGLVNTHSHLELTGLTTEADRADFPGWIRALRAAKSGRRSEWFAAAARRGVRHGFAAGTTTFADTGDASVVLPALVEERAAGVAYHEVFGPHPDQCPDAMAGLTSQVQVLRPNQTPRVRLGLSPHAPYTVSGPLYRAVGVMARREGLPVAVHLAESRAETSLVTRGEGAFAMAWRARGIPPLRRHRRTGPSGWPRSPVAWLDALGVLGPRTLVVHAVQVDGEDVALLRERGVSIAHCPGSNRAHRHGDAPLRRLRAAGLTIGLGTDSELSVGSPDLFAELRLARTMGDLTATEALALVTRDAAHAIGLGERVGRLVPGLDGDVVVLDVVLRAGETPEEAILRAGPANVAATFAGGRAVYRRRPAA